MSPSEQYLFAGQNGPGQLMGKCLCPWAALLRCQSHIVTTSLAYLQHNQEITPDSTGLSQPSGYMAKQLLVFSGSELNFSVDPLQKFRIRNLQLGPR